MACALVSGASTAIAAQYSLNASASYELPLDIPDQGRVTLQMPLQAADSSEVVTEASLGITVSHSYAGDLAIELTSPGGSTIVIKSSDSQDSSRNVLISNFPLNLAGETANGIWSVQVTDSFEVDTGSVAALTLSVTTEVPDSGPPADPVIDEGATQIFENWFTSETFGIYETSIDPWLFMLSLGWVYVSDGPSDDVFFFYSASYGWLYVAAADYPYVYSFYGGRWLYIETQSEATAAYDPNIYDFSENAWTTGTALAESYGIVTTAPDVTLTLLTPRGDPGSAPDDSGRGQNEYTFSEASVGTLTVQFEASVSGVSDPSTIRHLVSFSIDNIGTAPEWASGNPNGVSSASRGLLTAEAVFTGLPYDNASFGKKTARMYYRGNLVEETEIEVFFPKDASNHPGTGRGTTPNWFYYWKQGDVCGIPDDAIYDGSDNGYGYVRPGFDTIVRLGPLAATTNSGPETYTSNLTNTTVSPAVPYGSLTVAGQGEGIQCVAETVEHELYHLVTYEEARGKVDADNDGVADSMEPTWAGIPSATNNADTYNMTEFWGSVYQDYADDEIRCRLRELDLSFEIYPEKDWANPGSQSRNQFGPKP